MKHVRIFMRCTNDDDTAPMCFDVAIDNRNAVAGRWVIFGLQGETDDDSTWYPMVCRYDGVIDFGHDRERRWAKTDLRQSKMQVGEKVNVQDDDGQDYIFVIEEVHAFD